MMVQVVVVCDVDSLCTIQVSTLARGRQDKLDVVEVGGVAVVREGLWGSKQGTNGAW